MKTTRTRRERRDNEREVQLTQAIAYRIARGELHWTSGRRDYVAQDLADYYHTSFEYVMRKITRMLGLRDVVVDEKKIILLD